MLNPNSEATILDLDGDVKGWPGDQDLNLGSPVQSRPLYQLSYPPSESLGAGNPALPGTGPRIGHS